MLFPGFALTSFSLAIEAVSVANQLSQQAVYDYRLYNAGPKASYVVSSNVIPVAVDQYTMDCESASVVFICAYQNAAQFNNKAVLRHLRKLHNQGSQLHERCDIWEPV